MSLFVLREGYQVVTTSAGGRIVHLRTGDSRDLSPEEVQLFARATAGGVDAKDPKLRSLVRKFASLGLLVTSSAPPAASGSSTAVAAATPPSSGAPPAVSTATTSTADVSSKLSPPSIGSVAAATAASATGPWALTPPASKGQQPEPTRPPAVAPPKPKPEDIVRLFRADLKVSRRTSSALFDLTDPITGKSFPLYDFEVSLTRMLDGRRRYSDVLEAGQRLGIPVNLESLLQFIRQLEIYGFLAPPGLQLSDARKSMRAPRQKWDESIRALFQSGLRMHRQGRYAEAANYFEAMLEQDKQNAEALDMLEQVRQRLSIGAGPGKEVVPLRADPAQVSFEELLLDDDVTLLPEGSELSGPAPSRATERMPSPAPPLARPLPEASRPPETAASPAQPEMAGLSETTGLVETTAPAATPTAQPETLVRPETMSAPQTTIWSDTDRADIAARSDTIVRPDTIARADPAARPDAMAEPETTERAEGAGLSETTLRLETGTRPEATALPETTLLPDSATLRGASFESIPYPVVRDHRVRSAERARTGPEPRRTRWVLLGIVTAIAAASVAAWYFLSLGFDVTPDATHVRVSKKRSAPKKLGAPSSALASPLPDGGNVVVLAASVHSDLAASDAAAAARPDAGPAQEAKVSFAAGATADAGQSSASAKADAGQLLARGEPEPTPVAPVVAVGSADASVARPAIGRGLEGADARQMTLGWVTTKIENRGRVTMGELLAPADGNVSWKASPQQRVRRGEIVGSLQPHGDGEELLLKAPKDGLFMPKPRDKTEVKKDEQLAAIVYHEAYLQASVADASPEPGWPCEVFQQGSGTKASCKIITVVKRGAKHFVTATTEPTWFDTADDARLRVSAPR